MRMNAPTQTWNCQVFSMGGSTQSMPPPRLGAVKYFLWGTNSKCGPTQTWSYQVFPLGDQLRVWPYTDLELSSIYFGGSRNDIIGFVEHLNL